LAAWLVNQVEMSLE